MTKTPRYWRENQSRYNMIGVKCANCGKAYFPQRTMCPDCGRKSIGRMGEFKFSGAGKIYSITVVHEAHEQYDMQKPYIIALIELDEGAKILGQIIDAEPDDVKIGDRVRSTLRKLGEEGKAGIIYYGYKFAKEQL
jgi:uncharacterized OB-fold protein